MANAERLIAEKLKKRRATNGGLKKLAMGTELKGRIARRLGKETVMTFNWTVERRPWGAELHAERGFTLPAKERGSGQ